MTHIRSLSWETEEGWEKVVCEPVIKYPMAPREARALLELAGRLLSNGMYMTNIIHLITVSLSDDEVDNLLNQKIHPPTSS